MERGRKRKTDGVRVKENRLSQEGQREVFPRRGEQMKQRRTKSGQARGAGRAAGRRQRRKETEKKRARKGRREARARD